MNDLLMNVKNQFSIHRLTIIEIQFAQNKIIIFNINRPMAQL